MCAYVTLVVCNKHIQFVFPVCWHCSSIVYVYSWRLRTKEVEKQFVIFIFVCVVSSSSCKTSPVHWDCVRVFVDVSFLWKHTVICLTFACTGVTRWRNGLKLLGKPLLYKTCHLNTHWLLFGHTVRCYGIPYYIDSLLVWPLPVSLNMCVATIFVFWDYFGRYILKHNCIYNRGND